jgi:hypothetical protein
MARPVFARGYDPASKLASGLCLPVSSIRFPAWHASRHDTGSLAAIPRKRLERQPRHLQSQAAYHLQTVWTAAT